MKHAKRLSALICVIVICFTMMIAPSAHAAGSLIPQNFGAWISAGLMSINIIGQSLLPAPGPIDPYYQWLSSPASLTQQYEYPVGRSVIQDYLNASTIVVRQGVTTIDGVEYDEVFVEPGTFTNGLKTNLFDFKTKWNILSGQSGITLASGIGHVGGLPVYYDGSSYRTAGYEVAAKGSSAVFGEIQQETLSDGKLQWRKVGHSSFDVKYFNYPGPWFLEGYPSSSKFVSIYREDGTVFTGSSSIYDLTFDNNAFNYGYTSGIVPADQSEIPENYGLSIQIPHDQLQTFYNTYPQYNYDNVTINIQEDEVDIDQLTQAIFDQITSMDQLKASWSLGEEPVPPEPVPPEPVPPEPAEDVLEGLNTIADQQYQSSQIQYQNYAIQQQQLQQQQQQLQQQQQQLQQQQQINQNTNSIKETIQNVTQTPSTDDLPEFKFDLREFFPFCIPFDIYRLLTSFDAEPIAPHVQIPFVIQSLNFSYNIDLDFSVFNPVAQVLRTVEFIVYALGLAWATGKVIKW